MKNYTIILVLCIMSFTSCKSQQVNNEKLSFEIQKIMQHVANRLETTKYRLSPEVLKLHKSKNKIDTLYSDDFFWTIKNTDIESIEDIIDFTILFDDEDYQYMKQQVKENSLSSWDGFIKYDFKKVVKNNSNLNNYRGISYYRNYSLPVLSKNHLYAIVYAESLYGGSLIVFKKNINGIWTPFAGGMVWIS